MLVLNILIGILLICCSYIFWTRRKFYWLSFKLPGLIGFPFIGIAYLATKLEDILPLLEQLRVQYGSMIYTWLGSNPLLIISNPEYVEKIFTSTSCVNKATVYEAVTKTLGYGLFSSSTPDWNRHRKLLNPAFSNKILLSFMPIFNRGANIFNKNLEQIAGKGKVDLTQMLQRTTINIAAQTTMGKDMSSDTVCVDGNDTDLLKIYQKLLALTLRIIVMPFLKYNFILKMVSFYSVYKNGKARVRSFIQDLIQEKVLKLKLESNKRETNNNYDSIAKPKNIFVDIAIDLAQKNEFTWKDVEAESSVIVIAAFETTAGVVYNTLMLLAMFPEYQQKLFEEVFSLFPDKNFEINNDDIPNLVYTEMVINECMRLLAPVPLVGRSVATDFQLREDIILPKGQQIIIDIFNLQRSEEVWGPKAKTFFPDHFLPDNLSNIHKYGFIPFTKGLRNCIGWRYAYISIKVLISKIIRNYRFTTDFDFHELQYVENITLKFQKLPLLEVHRRDF